MAVVIITGDVDSGKTSWCKQNLLEKKDHRYDGVLLLKIFSSGQRTGYDALRVSTGQTIPFARRKGFEPEDWHSTEKIGVFSISRKGKKIVNRWIREASSRNVEGIIIDEVGPLEILGRGLADSVQYALNNTPSYTKIFMVVRKDCLKEVCHKFNIKDHMLISI